MFNTIEKPNSQAIFNERVHFLDIAADPQWLLFLLRQQIECPAVREAGQQILGEIKPNSNVTSLGMLQRIQRYIHDHTRHMDQADHVLLFGYLRYQDIPYEESLINSAIGTIREAIAVHLNSAVGTSQERSTFSRLQHMSALWGTYCEGKIVPAGRMGPYRESVKLGVNFWDKPVLQCAEEATLAGALAVLIADTPIENLVFVVSPAHIVIFIRPGETLHHGGAFDSKMFYSSRKVKKINRLNMNYFLQRVGQPWYLLDHSGYADLRENADSCPEHFKKILAEMENFFGD